VRHQSDARNRCCCFLTIAAILSSLVALSLIIVAAAYSSVECGWCAVGATLVSAFEFGLAYASRERKFDRMSREEVSPE
jgi:hypothetical protein